MGNTDGMQDALFSDRSPQRRLFLVRSMCRSVPYCAFIVLIMVLSELFSLEVAAFWIYLAAGIFTLLFTEDSLGIVPIALCGYMTVSRPNSTVHFLGNTIFDSPAYLVQFAVILGIGVCALAVSFAVALRRRKRRGAPLLLNGFIALGAAYMLGGILSDGFGYKTVLFGFVQFVSLALFYVYFHYTVEWERVPKRYAPALVLLIGLGLLIQIAGMYRWEIREGENVVRKLLFTGWGTYNNVACMLAMCIPAPFYFAWERRHAWAYALLGCAFYTGVLFTQSRGGILFGGVLFVICAFYTVYTVKQGERTGVFLVFLAYFAALLLALSSLGGELHGLFASLLKAGADDSNRKEIYRNCFRVFLSHPVFGVGFYATPGFAFPSEWSFLPPRAHNTYLQLLATGGIVLFAAYVYHRITTLRLLLCRPTREKTFTLLCVAALLMTSFVDCHFFNIGPPILYGVLLGFAEHAPPPSRLKTRE